MTVKEKSVTINIPTEATAVDVLKALDSWAHAVRKECDLYTWSDKVHFEKEVRKFWQYITAFRGPDSDNSKLKYDTAAVIRWLTVPHLAEVAGAVTNSSTVNAETLLEEANEIDEAGCGRYRENLPERFQEHGIEAQVHFLAHYIWAVYNILADKEVLVKDRPGLME